MNTNICRDWWTQISGEIGEHKYLGRMENTSICRDWWTQIFLEIVEHKYLGRLVNTNIWGNWWRWKGCVWESNYLETPKIILLVRSLDKRGYPPGTLVMSRNSLTLCFTKLSNKYYLNAWSKHCSRIPVFLSPIWNIDMIICTRFVVPLLHLMFGRNVQTF